MSELSDLLFGSSEYGALYDPSDISTLFQDTAGSTPVTADGDPVQRVEDVSGNDLYLTIDQGASATYRDSGGLQWLEFTGSQVFASATLSSNVWAGSGHFMAVAARSTLANTTQGLLFEQHVLHEARRVGIYVNTGDSAGENFVFFDPTNTGASFLELNSQLPDGDDVVLASNYNGTTADGYRDKEHQDSVSVSDSFSVDTRIDLGWEEQDSGGLYFSGRFYGGFMRAAEASSSDRDRAIELLGERAGLALYDALPVLDTTHDQSVEPTSVFLEATTQPANATSAQTATNTSLSSVTHVEPAPTSHSQTAQQPSVTRTIALSTNNAPHPHLAGTPHVATGGAPDVDVQKLSAVVTRSSLRAQIYTSRHSLPGFSGVTRT